MLPPPQDRRSSGAGSARIFLILGALVLVAAVAAFWLLGGKGNAKPKPARTASIIPILPPPPPPPTPPPTPPPAPPDPVEPPPDAPEFVEETAPDSPPEPDVAPDEPAPMGSNIQGDGPPDGFGLVGRGGGGMIGGSGRSGGAGSKFGWYAGKVQSEVISALRSHRTTRSARLAVKARIWIDPTGRVTRATLEGSSGDPDIDRALQQEILSRLTLREPPPEGMPMPIVMRISGSRP